MNPSIPKRPPESNRWRPSGLYLILDHRSAMRRPLIDLASAAIAGGVKHIQYRAKGLSKQEAYVHSRQLKVLAHQNQVTLLINDSVDLALAIEADGVHLGQEDLPLSIARALLGPRRVIGISVHTFEEAHEAEIGGADYLSIGPVFPSTTKPDRPPIGCERLRQFREKVHLPLVAIGGISALNIRQVMETKVEGVAVAAAILSRPDVTKATAELVSLIYPD